MPNTQRLPSFQNYGDSRAENSPTGPRGPQEPPLMTSTRVVELVSVEKTFKPAEMRRLLGNLSKSTYYRITRKGLLKYSELFPHGPRVHTQQQYADYVAYLNQHSDPDRLAPTEFPTRPGARRFK